MLLNRKSIVNILVTVMFLCLLVCSGCGTEENVVDSKSAQGYAVTDATGTKLHFAEKPQRIVSMSIGTDEILMDLVPIERILCVTHLADDAGISNIVDRVKNIPHRSYGNTPEAVLAMKPDLVLLSDFFLPEAIQTLRDMGLKVYVCKTPSKFEDILSSIREIAVVVGEPQAGEKLIDDMQSKLNTISKKIGNVPTEEQKSVLYVSTLGAFYSPDGTFRDTCRKAMVRDVTEKLAYSKPCSLSPEVVVELNPDSFVIGDWNHDGKNDPNDFKEELLANKSYMTTKASQNKSVVIVPSAHLLTCSQYFVLGVEDLAKAVYPEKFY